MKSLVRNRRSTGRQKLLFALAGIVIFALLGVVLWQAVGAREPASLEVPYQPKKSNAKQQSSATPVLNSEQKAQATQELQAAQTAAAEWKAANAGAFTMRVPDGWKLQVFPDNHIGGVDIAYAAGKPAAIETQDSPYVSHLLKFSARITTGNSDGLHPQWESPQQGLTETADTFAIGTLAGKRFTGVFTGDLNQTLYQYVFDLGKGQRLNIVYTVFHNQGDTADLATVEKAIRTIQVK